MDDVCDPIDECLFGVDGICEYCGRSEPAKVSNSDDEDEDNENVYAPHQLY